MIYTSQSRYQEYLRCPRAGWLAFDAPNGTTTGGWQRRKLALPLATGQYIHQALAYILLGSPAVDMSISQAVADYQKEVADRGLDCEPGTDAGYLAQEQASWIEAILRAWVRVRLPFWRQGWDIVDVEREETVALSEDVTLMARADAIVRRKADKRLFLVNWRTTAQADDRWYRGFETDMQLLTEVLAVEARIGEKLGGVIVEGFIKGRRMPERDREGNVTGFRQHSPLIYGYKFGGNPPLEPVAYDWQYKRAKGWRRFSVWREAFHLERGQEKANELRGDTQSPVDYWVNWLPQEVLEQQFAIVPPIMRDERALESKRRQMVTKERRINVGCRRFALAQTMDEDLLRIVDEEFPQNERACIWPSRCPCHDICWTGGVSADIAGSGLYQPREPHHPQEKRT